MRMTLIYTAALAVVSFPALAAPPCPRGQVEGSAECPVYTAPAATAVPGQPVDGSMTVPAGSTLLFGGIRLPNGFMVQVTNGFCFVNDNGPAGSNSGFFIYSGGGGVPPLFVTPPGYRQMGPVSIWCNYGGYIAARAW